MKYNIIWDSHMSDFGLTSGVLGKTLLHLAVKVSYRVAREEILKNRSFSIPFIYPINLIKVENGLF